MYIPLRTKNCGLQRGQQNFKKKFSRDTLIVTSSLHQEEGALVLDVVVRDSSFIHKLPSSKDQTLLVRGNSLLVLDLKL